MHSSIYSETFEIIHSRGVITLLAIYKIPKLKYVVYYNKYMHSSICSETFEIIHSRGVVTLLAIYKIPKLKYVVARCAIRL